MCVKFKESCNSLDLTDLVEGTVPILISHRREFGCAEVYE